MDNVKANSLNRTFYGIETLILLILLFQLLMVLIVPFMELKLFRYRLVSRHRLVLIVPFMELKL